MCFGVLRVHHGSQCRGGGAGGGLHRRSNCSSLLSLEGEGTCVCAWTCACGCADRVTRGSKGKPGWWVRNWLIWCQSTRQIGNMTLMVPTEVEGYGRLTPSKRALPLRNSQLGWVHEASAGTLIETPAFLSSVFCFPTPVFFPPNCRLPRAVRKHYSLVFTHSQNPAGDPLPPHCTSTHLSPHLHLLKTIREERSGP